MARRLLEIGAVTLSPREPYTWASGVKSPVYCDCRRVMSFVEARNVIENAWADLVKEKWPDVGALAGVATGGIPHAALVAERLALPMVYIRSKPKDHGLGKRVEGVIPDGAKVVVMEDLVSTGSSLLDGVSAVREVGGNVVGVSSIFTYEFDIASEAFKRESVGYASLSSISAARKVAQTSGKLSAGDLKLLDEGMRSIAEQLRNRK